MNLSFIFRFFAKVKKESISRDHFADFIVRASTKEKQQVFRKAAARANKDQMAIFHKAKMVLQTK